MAWFRCSAQRTSTAWCVYVCVCVSVCVCVCVCVCMHTHILVGKQGRPGSLPEERFLGMMMG